MIVYIIQVIDRETNFKSISQEAYTTFEKAIEFITTRSDKVEAVSPWTYATEDIIYKITDIRVV